MPVDTSISPSGTPALPPHPPDHPVWNSIRAIGHGIGWLIPGVQEAQAMEASTNSHKQQGLLNMLSQDAARETLSAQQGDADAPNRLRVLQDIASQLRDMGPFDNPKKLNQRYMEEYKLIHPDTYGAVSPRVQQQPTQAPPAPAGPGEVNGQPRYNIPPVEATSPIVGPLGVPEQRLGSMSAAQPAGSPVQQPAAGGAAGPTPNPFPSPATSSPSTGVSGAGSDQGSQGSPTSVPVGMPPVPGLTLPQRPLPLLPPPSMVSDTTADLNRALEAYQSPYVQSQAAVETALNNLRGTKEFQMAEMPRQVQMLKNAGVDINTLPPALKAEVVSSLMGTPIPGIGAAFVPHTISSNVLGSDILAGNPDARDPRGNPVDPKQRYNIKLIGGQEVYESGTAQTHQVFDYDPNTKKFYSVSVDQSGREIGRFETVPPAGYRPTITYQNGIRMVTQPDNTIQAVPIRTSSERVPDLAALGGMTGGQPTPGVTGPGTTVGAVPPAAQTSAPTKPTAPTASVAGPGKTVGGKGITPQERIGWEGKLGAATSALEIVKDIRRELPVVQNMLQAKKISLAIDPNQGLIVHRLLPLTDEEAKLAGDLESMREHINVLRQPLGAGGFRSEEAWQALQSMFGGLGLNPKVSDQIIGRTVQSMNRQINAITRGLKGQHDFPTDYAPIAKESAEETKPSAQNPPPASPTLSKTAEAYWNKKHPK